MGYVGLINPPDHVDHLIRAAHVLRHGLGRTDIALLDVYRKLLPARALEIFSRLL